MKLSRLTGILIVALMLASVGGCASGSKDTGDSSDATMKPADASALAGKNWVLTRVDGVDVPATHGPRHPSLRFSPAEKRVTGHAGVNQFGGEYSAQGEKLSFGMLAMTKMAGPPEAMALESRFSHALSATTGWRIENGELVLLSKTLPVARFKAE